MQYRATEQHEALAKNARRDLADQELRICELQQERAKVQAYAWCLHGQRERLKAKSQQQATTSARAERDNRIRDHITRHLRDLHVRFDEASMQHNQLQQERLHNQGRIDQLENEISTECRITGHSNPQAVYDEVERLDLKTQGVNKQDKDYVLTWSDLGVNNSQNTVIYAPQGRKNGQTSHHSVSGQSTQNNRGSCLGNSSQYGTGNTSGYITEYSQSGQGDHANHGSGGNKAVNKGKGKQVDRSGMGRDSVSFSSPQQSYHSALSQVSPASVFDHYLSQQALGNGFSSLSLAHTGGHGTGTGSLVPTNYGSGSYSRSSPQRGQNDPNDQSKYRSDLCTSPQPIRSDGIISYPVQLSQNAHAYDGGIAHDQDAEAKRSRYYSTLGAPTRSEWEQGL